MEEQFIPYELALKLKELGFNRLCLAHFDGGGFRMFPVYDPLRNEEIKEPWFCTTPLWQQAFDWFREKYELLNHLTTHLDAFGGDGALEESYGYRIMINKDGWKCSVWEKLSNYDSYQESRQACLEQLIEICKTEKK